MTELAHTSTDYSVVEREPPRVMAENLRMSARLWSSSTAFFFFAFLFAYFYLRSLNQGGLWKPKHVDPSVGLGTAITACVVVAAGLLLLGLRDHRAERRPAWRIKGAVAVGFILVSIILQVVEWATQGFGPTQGGFASVYIGWTSMQFLFLIGLLYWVETTLATSIRYRNTRPSDLEEGTASGDADRTAPDIENPLSLVRPQLEALSFFAAVFAGIVTASWIILYLL